MRVLIDTPIWSLSLRRARKQLSTAERGIVFECRDLISAGRAVLLGSVRQEVLSGIREDLAFERIRLLLSGFEDEPLEPADFELAARCSNQFRAKAVSSSPVDCLIVASAIRRHLSVFTTDRDFPRYQGIVTFALHSVPGNTSP